MVPLPLQNRRRFVSCFQRESSSGPDFSENSEPACKLAVDYAKAFGSELLIIHVIDSSGFPTYADWMIPSIGDELNKILLRAQESAETRLGALARECSLGMKEVRTFCKIGLAPKEIVSLAAAESVDLIVVGTHGLYGCQASRYGEHSSERSQNGSSSCADRGRPPRQRGIIGGTV